jgi:tRNA threonylcarbamoyladenosine biosynthesis protein TsaB
MITLAMDTSHVFLVLALIRDDALLDSVEKKCWKRQSEEIFPCLMDLMERNHLKPDDIDQMVITEGPGSYTGVRIAMTVAKVFCVMKNKPLYTLGTLQLFGGKNDGRVILDARGHRVYTAVLKNGAYTEKPHIMMLDEVNPEEVVSGDLALVHKEENYGSLSQNFAALKDQWVKADNVNLVKPEYLKPSTAYLVK